jgi:hypothetical protein
MTQPTIVYAADYADALLTARRFKNVLFFAVLVALLLQVALFFLARYDVMPLAADGQGSSAKATLGLQYLTTIGTFVGLIGTMVLSMVLLLIAIVMLVGRLVGVGRATKAYIWTIVLLTLMFPWQAVYVNPTLMAQQQSTDKDFRVPGVMYTWTELSHPQLGAKFARTDVPMAVLRWARFVGFPAVAVILLLIIQANSARALRQALGEVGELPDTTPGNEVPTA